MDMIGIVQSKLGSQDNCIYCCTGLGSLSMIKGQLTVALVEGEGNHCGLFFYQVDPVGDLHLAKTIPIDAHFQDKVFSNANSSLGMLTTIQFLSEQEQIEVEFPEDEQCKTLIDLLQKTRINQFSPSRSSFHWMEKYTDGSSGINPFLEDTFDPFKTSALSESLSTSSNSLSDWPSRSLGNMDRSLRQSFEKSLDDAGNLDGKVQSNRHRESLIRMVMDERAEEFTEIRTIRLFCGTWNVNGQAASENLSSWLACDPVPPDVIVVCFQELDLSKNAYIFSDSIREAEWLKRCEEGLPPKAKYDRLRIVRLIGMMMIVYVKDALHKHVKRVASSCVGTGIMGMLGNKGGVAVRLELFDTTICFVNSHLAAHTEEFERRNQDFRDINSKLSFVVDSQTNLQICNHEMVFWIGDLNYRLSNISAEEAKALIKKSAFDKLLPYDQLSSQMSSKQVFLDYIEGKITFPPSYKYDPGTDDWDSSEKNRAPAWCDRILWRANKHIKQITYRSHSLLRLSDHKPVSGLFSVGVQEVNNTNYQKVYEDAMKKLDKLENEYLPQVEISTGEIHFKEVRFYEQYIQTLLIHNTGQIPIQFCFISKPNEDKVCKPWLTVRPLRASIGVGEKLQVELEVKVDASSVASIEKDRDLNDDILILHLVKGKDLFITVRCDYIPSVFGLSLERLLHLFGPVRDAPTAQLLDLESTDKSTKPNKPMKIPKEIWRLVDHINNFGLNEENLFTHPGNLREVLQIRNALDTGVPIRLPGAVHSVAEALIVFLESLQEPVVPFQFYDKCLGCSSNFILSKQVVSQFPASHRSLFVYICSFLRKVIESQPNLKLHLAHSFSLVLLRSPVQDNRSCNDRKKADFLYHFLVNSFDE